MKILFDTNIYVSSAIFRGAAMRAIKATVAARWKVYICDTILIELDRILRERFHRGGSFSRSTVQVFRAVTVMCDEPESRHQVPGDADDTPILRAAVGAGVDYLVTQDSELLELSPVEGVRIVTLAEYLVILETQGLLRD